MKDKGLDVMLVSFDSVGGADDFKEKLARVGFHDDFGTFYVKDAEASERLGVRDLPVAIIIGPDGMLRFRIDGETAWMGEEMLAFMRDLLQN